MIHWFPRLSHTGLGSACRTGNASCLSSSSDVEPRAAAERATRHVLLKKRRLPLEHLETFLEACDLRLAALLLLLVGLRLRNTLLLDLGPVLVHGIQLRLHSFP